MKTVAEVIGVSRSNLAERLQQRPRKRIGRPALPDQEFVAQIKGVIAELPTYGYRRVHAILKRQALAAGLKPPNHKRVYRMMKAHGLLLDRHAGGVERRHDGRTSGQNRPSERVAFGAMTKILLSRPSPKTSSFLGTGMLGLAKFYLLLRWEVSPGRMILYPGDCRRRQSRPPRWRWLAT